MQHNLPFIKKGGWFGTAAFDETVSIHETVLHVDGGVLTCEMNINTTLLSTWTQIAAAGNYLT